MTRNGLTDAMYKPLCTVGRVVHDAIQADHALALLLIREVQRVRSPGAAIVLINAFADLGIKVLDVPKRTVTPEQRTRLLENLKRARAAKATQAKTPNPRSKR